MPDTKSLYRDEFIRHINAGDDDLNARLRIIETGCPPDLAEEIEREEGGDDD